VGAAVALRNVDFPFDIDRILTAELSVPWRVRSDSLARAALIRRVTEELRAAPGFEAAALVSTLPGRGAGFDVFQLDGAATTDAARPRTGFTSVTPEFLDVVGARVIRGRALAWTDDRGSPRVLLVNESFVRRHSPDRDPVGRQITFGRVSHTIVGVVPDLQMQDVDSKVADGVYAPLLQMGPAVLRVVARVNGDPLALIPTLRAALARVDAGMPLIEVGSLRAAIYADKKILDAFAALFLGFGAGALFLTTIGLYGVVSFAVERRSREFAIRQALGATPRDVIRLVMRQGAAELGIGIGVGLALAVALSRGLSAALEVVTPASPLTLAAIAGTLVLTALIGFWRPTRRAVALPPVQGLRAE
jgi:hypothetical protein